MNDFRTKDTHPFQQINLIMNRTINPISQIVSTIKAIKIFQLPLSNQRQKGSMKMTQIS